MITLSLYFRMTTKQLHLKYIQRIDNQKNHILPSNLNNWLLELSSARQLVKDERELLPKRKRDEFDRQFYDKMLKYKTFSIFRHKVNSKLNNFSTRLEQKNPTLSEKDLILLYFILLQIPNEDILLLTGYAPSSLPTTKQRLAKKIGISHVNDMFSTLISWI